MLAQLRIKFWLLSKHSGKWFLKNLVKNCTTKMIFIAATGFYWGGRGGGGGGRGEESKVKLTTPEDLRWLIAYLLLDYANGTEFMFTIKI